jgi:cytochrome b pre-mRNA-processing protein 3
MLWPFNHFRKPRLPPRGTFEAIYGMIVTQAREPLFYRDLGVADTVNGRFDLLILHLWMVLRRLRPMEGGERLAQALFDRFCADLDDNLREMGVGDLTVPKRMQAFGEAFYGRAAAYDLAVDLAIDSAPTDGAEPLAQALCKNILNGTQIDNARRLAAYAGAAIAALAAQDDAALLAASWRFPMPDCLPDTLPEPLPDSRPDSWPDSRPDREAAQS